MEPVKITSLELENVKRIRAVQIVPTKDGLTVIGGRNGSSVPQAWEEVGGKKMQPDNPNRDGAATPAKLHVELSNGIVVERRGKNGTLYVTDMTGKKGTQKLLDEFLSHLALCLPSFINGTDKDRTTALLQTLGIDQQLASYDGKIKATMEERKVVGRDAKQKRSYANGLPKHSDVPEEPVSVGELSARLMEAHDTNRENQRKRDRAFRLKSDHEALADEIAHLRQHLGQMEAGYEAEEAEVNAAFKEAMACEDVDTTEIEASIANVESINAKVRDNQRRAEADLAAQRAEKTYQDMTESIETMRKQRVALLDNAPLPLDGLSVNEDMALTYNGQTWGDMSGSEQLRVATAIVRATKPDCGFVLVDGLEQLDSQTLDEFGAWAQSEGLQVIGTRVGTDDSCTIVIEDGKVEGQSLEEPVPPDPKGEALGWDSEATKSVGKWSW